jgi:hypothetical protein
VNHTATWCSRPRCRKHPAGCYTLTGPGLIDRATGHKRLESVENVGLRLARLVEDLLKGLLADPMQSKCLMPE